VVPIGTYIVSHRLDSCFQFHASGWRSASLHTNIATSSHPAGSIFVKFHTPRKFSPGIKFSLGDPISDIKRKFLLELNTHVMRTQSKHDDASDTIRRLPESLYQLGDYLSLLDASQLRFLCDGRSLPVNLDTPIRSVIGSSVGREVCIWVSGPEAALSYESSLTSDASLYSYQDSIAVWLKSVHLQHLDEQLTGSAKFHPKLPIDICDDPDVPEHPSILCSTLKLAVKPSLGPRDIQFQVCGVDGIEQRSHGREVGFLFPSGTKPTLILNFLNDFHEPTLANPELCPGVLTVRRYFPTLASFEGQDNHPEPVLINVSGNSVEFKPAHPAYPSIVDSTIKSKLVFSLKLDHDDTKIQSILHLDTLEGNAENLVVNFDPKLPILAEEHDTYIVTAEQPLKLDICTADQTGRPSQRGLGHIGATA
jgi:hypothetical protein